ncbi:MAG TPA: DUF5715 family protein [Streptosporangiaceae bacterium]|jgi:hypothetical protein|nr:DUF5715 family protein [Streptosporangiaceae bacterium]
MTTHDSALLPGGPLPAPNPEAYRAAVADLQADLAGCCRSADGSADTSRAEKAVADRITEPAFQAVLAATPGGVYSAARRLLQVIRDDATSDGKAADLPGRLRIHLLAQIDIMWWGQAPTYFTDGDLLRAPDLTDLDALRRSGQLRFRYRRQASRLPSRAVRAAERRLLPDRTPQTAGLRFTRARPETVILLNRMAFEFANAAAPGTPPLWVTSLARSVQHQRRLRALGYAAALPSAHCAGYAIDIEMDWFRRSGADMLLGALLLEHQRAGDLNVIEEGQVWHACLSPSAVAALRQSDAIETLANR